MSFRTKHIMEMVKQQAGRVEAVEYTVEDDGILSPIYAPLYTGVNETPLNIEAPSVITTDYTFEFSEEELSNPHISTNFDHLELPIVLNLNDADPINNELQKTQFPERQQDIEVVGNNITNISPEIDDSDVSYVPNEDDSDSNISVNGDNNSEGTNEPPPDSSLHNIKTRKKRKCSEEWSYNTNKHKRSKGLPYHGKKKIEETWNYNINKPGKCLPNPCNCTLSKKSSGIQCQKMTEEKRLKIFQTFWNEMTWSDRKLQVQTLVQCENVKRRRGQQNVPKRKYSIKYFLKVDLERFRVCKRMFGSTLGLKETMVLSWIKEFNKANGENDIGAHQISRKSEVRRAKFAEKNTAVYQFLQSLPKMESHYCRSSSKKLYLEPLWHSNAELYIFFKRKYCLQHHLEPASIKMFMKVFEELNLSLFTPKKDLCDVCEAYNTKNLSEEKYNMHQTLKLEARQEKEKDKSSSDLTVNVYAMDLQCVLLSPKSTVAAMYYKTKLIVHNFTIYNLKTKDGFCFLWNESEGGLTANEFSSIISFFVEQEIQKGEGNLREMIFFSDGCTGQNRNSTLANAFVNLAAQHNITFTQKYLFKGHTQMEVDSMHATIERQIRNRKINLPADYVYYCQKARSSPSPYHVKYITHAFFKKFDSLKFYTSIRPGRTVGDPVVTDIKALRYLPNCEIQFKMRHTDPWRELNQRLNKKIILCKYDELPSLFTERRKIKKEKYDHLQILKLGLLEDYQKFYDELPFE